ncbi:MAG: DUF4258 domain-containing protein [Microthrixaceae bacterium]
MQPLRCCLAIVAVVVGVVLGPSADAAIHAYDVSHGASAEAIDRPELSEASAAGVSHETEVPVRLTAWASHTYDGSVASRVGPGLIALAESPASQVTAGGEGAIALSLAAGRASMTPVSLTSTPSGLADDGARFVVDSAGAKTLRAKGPQGWINVSEHAVQRMTQRGISIDAVDKALTTQPFRHLNDGVWKTGYYDAGSKVFVGTVNGTATTVINTGPNYINNLKAAGP